MPTLDIDEQTFETSFAEMALASLKNKSPALVDYMMGFQLVERSDDDTRAVGFFGFKIGNTWVYVPAFFLAGKVKGVELLYVKDQDVFLPNEDGWVNYLIKRKPFVLGNGVSKDKKIDTSGIDLDKLRDPPGTKVGSARGEGFIIYGTDVTAPWAADGMAQFLPGEKKASVTLPQFLAHRGKINSYLKLMRKNAKVAAATLAFYTEKDFVEEQTKVAAARKQAAGGLSQSPVSADEDGKVTILDKGDVDANAGSAAFLDTEDKKRLMRGELVVVDNRAGNSVRKAYSADLSKTLFNPTEPGLYDVLTASGDFARMLVLHPASIGGGGNRDLRFLIHPSNGEHTLTWKTQIFASKQYDREDTEKAVSRMGMAVDKNPTTGDTWDGPRYIIVDARGHRALGPFTVAKKIQTVNGAQLLVKPVMPDIDGKKYPVEERMSDSKGLPFEGPMFSEDGEINLKEDGSEGYWGNYTASTKGLMQIMITDKKLTKMVHSGDITMVPSRSGFRLVELGEPLTGVRNMGTIADLHLGIGKFAEQVKVYSDGISLNVNSEAGEKTISLANKKLAYEYLLKDLHLDSESAGDIVKTASAGPFTAYRYYAMRLEGDGEKTASPFDRINQVAGFDTDLGVPVEDTSYNAMTFDDSLDEESVAGDPTVYQNEMGDNDAFEQYYKGDMEDMDKAVQTGQKDVFDAAAIGALINIDSIDDEIDSFVPNLISAVDKLGRTLFLIYWHGEEVQERYGKQEVKDLEDNVKSVFTKLGDVILDLKTQSPADEDFIASKNML